MVRGFDAAFEFDWMVMSRLPDGHYTLLDTAASVHADVMGMV
tara:strand:+ start:5665 stop:5790 length:126 start_codon:yes stop_codon:yes gene_type:complete